MSDLGALLNYATTYGDELKQQSSEKRAMVAAVKYKLIKDGKLNIRG